MSTERLTRRGLLGTAAAGAAAGSVPAAAEAKKKKRRKGPRKRKARVAVIGAGLAGLTAARELRKAGVSVVVVEARKRVGGRTYTLRKSDADLDVGGQWVGPQQTRLLALAKELGVKTFKTYNEGNNVYYRNGTLTPYASTGPFGPIPPDPTGAAEAFAAIQQLNSMAEEVPTEAPWTAPRAAEWDGQTFETWKNDNAQTPGGRFLLDLGVQAVWACEPRDISLLHILFYVAAAGSFENLINTANGAQESRFEGGAQQISTLMARALGRRVVLGSPVRRIVQPNRSKKVRVESDKVIVTADRVIVTVPPALAGRIGYNPVVPALRDQLTQRVPMGSVFKCQAVYDRPFWRDDGLTGQATSDTGPCKITFDNSPSNGRPGVLIGFIEGQEARQWGERSAAARRRAVLESFGRYFGAAARSPRHYEERNWGDEVWSRGCYVGFMPPGVLLDYGRALRKPVGRIHWAGTETATIWNGYMDGAVQSGQRVAKEVLAKL